MSSHSTGNRQTRSCSSILNQRRKKQAVYSLNVNTGALAPVVELQGLYWHYVPSRNEILQVVDPGTVKAISLADGKTRAVVTVDDLNTMMALSPDGKRIAYMTGGRGQSAENFSCEMSLMSIDGKPLGKLLPLQQDYITPNAWSPTACTCFTPEKRDRE